MSKGYVTAIAGLPLFWCFMCFWHKMQGGIDGIPTPQAVPSPVAIIDCSPLGLQDGHWQSCLTRCAVRTVKLPLAVKFALIVQVKLLTMFAVKFVPFGTSYGGK